MLQLERAFLCVAYGKRDTGRLRLVLFMFYAAFRPNGKKISHPGPTIEPQEPREPTISRHAAPPGRIADLESGHEEFDVTL